LAVELDDLVVVADGAIVVALVVIGVAAVAKLDPKFSLAYYQRGSALYEKQNLDAAIADFGEAVRINPNFDLAFYHRGLAWRDKREYDKAINDFSEAIRLGAKNAPAFDNRGLAYRMKGDRLRPSRAARSEFGGRPVRP
jgi:tetratricopeptide (TPR) repeat protein